MAGVKISIKVNKPKVTKFKIAGKTLSDAKKALDSGRDEWGLYDATQDVKSGLQKDKDGVVTSVTMVLNPVIELPDWGGYGAASKEQKASWDDMVKALEAHERRHHDIQVDSAKNLEKELKKAKALDVEAVEKMIEDEKKACQKAQDAYDVRSRHGGKEGVELDLDA